LGYQRVTNEFTAIERSILNLRQEMRNPERIASMQDTEGLIQSYIQDMTDLRTLIEQRNAHVSKMDELGGRIYQSADSMVVELRSNQDRIGPEVDELNASIIQMMLIISILVILIAITAAVSVPRSISRGLADIQTTLARISDSGDFSIRANDKREDEIGSMSKSVNHLLTNMQGAIHEANNVVGALAKGRFDQRIKLNLVGDLNELKVGINQSADNITEIMNELKRVMTHLRQGEFNVTLSTQAEGEYKLMIEDASEAMDIINNVIVEINGVMSKVSDGGFDQRIKVAAYGELDQLKNAINQTVHTLEDVIGDITHVMDAQTQGNLTKSVQVDCKGQLLLLKNAINNNAENLSGIIASAINSANVVQGAAHEVSRGSQDLSQRVQQQAAALEQTSATMDEMNSAVQNNTQNALEATKVARTVQESANNGTLVMQQTIDAMNSIQESSHKIADIVSLIDGIAFQTNLLALNAAVEAARAGEHGRGFAVVAGEVRALAQKSAEAAKDIKSLISESVNRIDQGTQLASQSGEVLQNINGEINHVTQMIEQIAQASRQQAEGVEQVHRAIADIDQVTQQNAALVEETSAAAESMNEQAVDLSRNMAFFTTNQTSRSAAAIAAPAKKPNAVKTPALSSPKSGSSSGKISGSNKIASAPKNAPASDEWSEF
jgi:methyl-accepting chemotaxis protein